MPHVPGRRNGNITPIGARIGADSGQNAPELVLEFRLGVRSEDLARRLCSERVTLGVDDIGDQFGAVWIAVHVLDRAVLLALGGNEAPQALWNNCEFDIVAARSHSTHWVIRNIGPVPVHTTVLIRPDGYVTWAADSTDNVPHTAPRIST